MNINQIRFVQAVAEIGSFSQAAERCCVTQPTLSNGIAHLEEELGGKLFERNTRSVSLTPLGRHLLPLIDQILDNLDELKSSARAWYEPDHKLIRISLSPVIDMKIVQKLVASFQEIHPDVEFFFKECFLDDMHGRLDRDQVEVAFQPSQERRIGWDRQPLYAEPLLYLPRSGSQLEQDGEHVDLTELSNDPLIFTVDGCGLANATRRLFEKECVDYTSYPGQALMYTVVEEWTDIGIGAGILPSSKLIVQNQTARPLLINGKFAMLECEATWKTTGTQHRHVTEFIQHLHNNTAAMAPLSKTL